VRRLLLATLHHVGLFVDRVARACVYCSAGLSRLDDLKAGTAAAWNDFLIEDREIAGGWMPWEQSIAERVLCVGARILVVGCGSGRDVIPFLERGCVVTGIDPARRAVEAARRALSHRRLDATLIVGFFEDVELDGRFDAIWFSWFAYSYIPDRRRRVAALRKAAALLTPGGEIVISILRHPPDSRLLHVAQVVGRMTGSDWAIDAGDVFTRVAGSRGLRYEHFFPPGDVEDEIASAGLKIVNSSENQTVLVLLPTTTNVQESP
jgi:SAM-dependent methyltransferase